mmetsp:Transcript_95431/g.269826  ORF Transcript_95431/g.269826 Transcript_95431/m.269826 type:complete len:226 (+) Transcript_95431:578-1255(+)
MNLGGRELVNGRTRHVLLPRAELLAGTAAMHERRLRREIRGRLQAHQEELVLGERANSIIRGLRAASAEVPSDCISRAIWKGALCTLHRVAGKPTQHAVLVKGGHAPMNAADTIDEDTPPVQNLVQERYCVVSRAIVLECDKRRDATPVFTHARSRELLAMRLGPVHFCPRKHHDRIEGVLVEMQEASGSKFDSLIPCERSGVTLRQCRVRLGVSEEHQIVLNMD